MEFPGAEGHIVILRRGEWAFLKCARCGATEAPSEFETFEKAHMKCQGKGPA